MPDLFGLIVPGCELPDTGYLLPGDFVRVRVNRSWLVEEAGCRKQEAGRRNFGVLGV
jgi:hypothetical protein